jgi:Squalene-hopene cyclase N-terminal domain
MNHVLLEPKSSPSALHDGIESATDALIALQKRDGHWVFELEADATIPAEYVLLRHYLAEPIDTVLEAKIAAYLRRIQGDHGGWPLFHDGAFDMSASVKAYFALKMIGVPVDAPHMVRARSAIRARGGASRSNVFTRMMLALFGFIPWRAVPVMPVEIMLLPTWFPFHLDKVSYWSRTVIVPLLVLQSLKPRARNPKGVDIEELFLEPPPAIGLAPKAAAEGDLVFVLPRRRRRVAFRRADVPETIAATRDRARSRMGDGASQRRRRSGRDFPGDGEQRDDVRRPRLSRASSAALDRAQIHRQAPRCARARGLLSALRVADLGYRARLSQFARSRRRARR